MFVPLLRLERILVSAFRSTIVSCCRCVNTVFARFLQLKAGNLMASGDSAILLPPCPYIEAGGLNQ